MRLEQGGVAPKETKTIVASFAITALLPGLCGRRFFSIYLFISYWREGDGDSGNKRAEGDYWQHILRQTRKKSSN